MAQSQTTTSTTTSAAQSNADRVVVAELSVAGPVFSMGEHTYTVPMQLHANNRARLLARFHDAPAHSLVLLRGGAQENHHATDHENLFRQESFFQWTFGVREPDCWGAIDIHRGGTSMLFIPRLPEEYAVWMGPIRSCEDFKQRYGVDEVYYVDEVAATIERLGSERLYLLQGLNQDSKTVMQAPTLSLGQYAERVTLDSERLWSEITECRRIKTALEISVIRYANRVSSRAHVEVMRACRAGMYEYQLESIFQHKCYMDGGCRNMAYTCICGAGVNSAVLHYGHAGAPNDNQIRDGDMLLMDMGAEYHCYNSDITCSFPANGKFTQDQRDVYESVLAAQQAVMRAMQPGVKWKHMHRLAERVILTELTRRGFLHGDVDEMVKANLANIFMPHGLGHLLGLDTHDVGGYKVGKSRSKEPGLSSLRAGRRLEEGIVITVEPGIYFIKPLLDRAYADENLARFLNKEKIERCRSFGGVRIEDNVVVTRDGIENLTRCPRTVDEIEAVMAGGAWEVPFF